MFKEFRKMQNHANHIKKYYSSTLQKTTFNKIILQHLSNTIFYRSNDDWKFWNASDILRSAMCSPPQITPSNMSGFSDCTLSAINTSNHAVSIVFD